MGLQTTDLASCRFLLLSMLLLSLPLSANVAWLSQVPGVPWESRAASTQQGSVACRPRCPLQGGGRFPGIPGMHTADHAASCTTRSDLSSWHRRKLRPMRPNPLMPTLIFLADTVTWRLPARPCMGSSRLHGMIIPQMRLRCRCDKQDAVAAARCPLSSRWLSGRVAQQPQLHADA